jgi:cation-transporting ATPase E
MKNSEINKAYNSSPTNPTVGLKSNEFMNNKKNKYQEPVQKNIGQMLFENTFTFFNILNFVLFGILIAFREYKNATFIFIAVFNIIIGVYQEIKARKTINKLKILSKSSVKVLRDSSIHEINQNDIVQNDIIILDNGDQIVVDGIVVGDQIEVDESQLTGESISILKKNGDVVFSGSIIVSGNSKMQAVNVAEDTYTAKLTNEVKKITKIKSELVSSVNLIVKVMSYVLIPVSILLVLSAQSLVNSGASTINAIISSTIGSIIGMIPEGLVLLTSVAFATGAVKMGMNNSLVQELPAIESIARMDMLCLDKTGTLTTGNLKLLNVVPISEKYNLETIKIMVSASKDNNATMASLKRHFNVTAPVEKINVPFDSKNKWSAVIDKDLGIILGAPEYILSDIDQKTETLIKSNQNQGNRVLAVATTVHTNDLINQEIKHAQNFAILVFEDELRKNAKETLEYFASQSVEIKVISGDNPETVSAIAQKLNLKNGEKWLDAREMSNDPEIVKQQLANHTVFGRVSPHQKEMLVTILQELGHFVGMTGDGVNDVLALKKSDCSIAMGQGSDASKAVSKIILLDSDFSNLPIAVQEGRRVVNNVEKVASLFLVKSTYSLIMAVILQILLRKKTPFEPIQLTLLSSVLVGIPAFVLALFPNKLPIKDGFMERIISFSLPSGIVIALTIMLTMWLGDKYIPAEQLTTALVLIAGIVHAYVLVKVSSPYSLLKSFIVGMFIIAFFAVFFIPGIAKIFDLKSLNIEVFIGSVLIGILGIGLTMLIRKSVTNIFFKIFGSKIKK